MLGDGSDGHPLCNWLIRSARHHNRDSLKDDRGSNDTGDQMVPSNRVPDPEIPRVEGHNHRGLGKADLRTDGVQPKSERADYLDFHSHPGDRGLRSGFPRRILPQWESGPNQVPQRCVSPVISEDPAQIAIHRIQAHH